MSTEWVVLPFFSLRRNNVGVGVEKNGGTIRVSTRPLNQHKRLPLDEFDGLGFEGDRFGLGDEEIGNLVVVWGRLGSVDLKVMLESRYGFGI